MANVLNRDKQIAVIGSLAEDSSIRAIERSFPGNRRASSDHAGAIQC